MGYRCCRTKMPAKPWLFFSIFCLIAVCVIYLHLGDQVNRLEATNKKLEHALVQMQQSGLSSDSQPQQQQQQQQQQQPLIFKSSQLASQSSAMPADSSDNLVVIYNRVPKTGSTSFMGVAYDLCAKNKFNVLHINTTKNVHVLSLTDQARFVYNVTAWSDKKPALYHGHIAYLDFERFGVSEKPIYINVIRKPLDRLISYYYFLRFGDDFRPYLVRKRQGDKMTFDECVQRQEQDCAEENMWMQIPFFCGHVSDCWVPGNEWALQQAKHNLVHRYLLVGVTEELQDFIALLDKTLPRFFRGSLDLFTKGKKSHLRKTTSKIDPLPETVAVIQRSSIWKMENEFYQFALEHFHFIRKRTLTAKDGVVSERGQQFFYEKIRPK